MLKLNTRERILNGKRIKRGEDERNKKEKDKKERGSKTKGKQGDVDKQDRKDRQE